MRHDRLRDHRITSVKKDGKVVVVHCECGGSFDSIESEALARLYLQRRIRHIERQLTK